MDVLKNDGHFMTDETRDALWFTWKKGERAKRVTAGYDKMWFKRPQREGEMEAVFEKQVGGIHYKDCKIQPVKFIQANRLGFLEGCIVKRLCRYRAKGGLEDLKKIQHEIELLIALEYPERSDNKGGDHE